MTVIDQSILIPTSPEVIWAIISDIDKNANWQADYQSVSFLTSLRSGTGVRWRYASPGGNDFVIETTAWYDGIGYEYTYVDGAPFRESKGRLRLQEIAEGTIVQWSLEYEMGGMLAGMRDSLSVRRQYEKLMVNSLRGLWTLVKETGGTRQDHQAKSLMRDAPDYEGRARYISRHPSRSRDAEEEAIRIDDPPISDDDTRPNPAVAVSDSEKSGKDQGWIEMEPVRTGSSSATETDENEQITAEDHSRFQPPAVDTQSDDVEILVQPDPESPRVSDSASTVAHEEMTMLPEMPRGEVESEVADDQFKPKLDTSKLDTREVSIWEVFGVPSPSETQRLRAIQDSQEIEIVAGQDIVDEALAADKDKHRDEEVELTEEPPDILETSEISIAPTMGAIEKSEETEVTEEGIAFTETDIAIKAVAENRKSDLSDEIVPDVVTRQLLSIGQSTIIGYRVNLRRHVVKIRRYR